MIKIRLLNYPALCLIVLLLSGQLAWAQDQQTITITGIVKDELNLTLPGVTITNTNTHKSVSTNENGKFSISASRGDSLVARFIGYRNYTFVFDRTIDFNITMVGEDNNLKEVVVVGYGQQKKINMVGSQSTVKIGELKQPVANLSATLAGRIAGVVGVQRTGLPGSNTADVWIRGISTFGDNAAGPLIVVDGVQGRSLNAFDPEDIASLTILKDASATAVYGAQGANGVILITTKKGTKDKPSLMFNYNQGLVNFTRTPELTNAEQYMRLRNEAMVASGLSPEYSNEYIQNTLNGTDPNLYPNVNWMDVIFKDASYNRRANFSARGGNENTQYYSSVAYYDESSLLDMDKLQSYKADSRFRRYNFTSNVDMNWTKTTRFTLGVQGYVTNTNFPAAQTDITATSGNDPVAGVQSIFSRVMQTTPVLYPLMYPGNLVPAVNQSSDAQPNPYALATQTGYINRFGSQLYSNARLSQELEFVTPGLAAHAMFSFDTFNSHTIARRRTRTTYGIDRSAPYNDDGSLNLVVLSDNGSDNLSYQRTNGGNRQFYFEGGFDYNRQFGKHNVTGLLLYTQTDQIAAFATDLTGSLPFRTQRLVGRANYLFDDRYVTEFNFAYDGSENFLPSRRYGFFPSFGVGWILSNERFFEPLKDAFQVVKLRYSNGITGSGGGGRRFGFLTIVKTNATGYSFYTGSGNTDEYNEGVAISDYGYDVTWAESHKQDVGLDVTTLNNRLNITLDWFKEHRTGVFLQRASLPSYLGLQNQPFGNLGIIDNQGLDGSVALEGYKIGQTTWSFNGTFTYSRNQLIDNDAPKQLYPYLERRGRNSLATFGYVADGLFQNQAEIDNHADQSGLGVQRPGDIRYKDLNGDGVINTYDQTKIGNGDIPNLLYGFGFNVSYKKFYVGAFFQGIDGAQRLLAGDGIIPFNNSTGPERSNLYAAAESRWTEDNPSQDVFYPRLGYGNSINKNNAVASTWWVKDIDFIRLKTVDLGYYLPVEKIKAIGVKNARIYFQGVNLLYWSKFKLWDPELNTQNGSSYPNIRTYSIGLQANF